MLNIQKANELLNTMFVPELLDKNKVPGCAIGIYAEGMKSHYFFGKRNIGAKVDEHTSFRVASLTKPVFAYYVHKLSLEGVLDLDTPLFEYYEDRYIDNYLIETVTARHILSHQTGFPNWAFDKPLDFDFPPGQSFQYSGEGIIYLQKTVEKLMGIDLHKLMYKEVYKPLRMTSSALAPQYLMKENMCDPHDKDGKLVKSEIGQNATEDNIPYFLRMPRNSNAAGTMWSSISDYTSFLYHLVFSEDDETTQILKQMTESQVEVKKWNSSWGLGIGLQNIQGSPTMWHWGDDNGFKTFTITDLKEKAGITIFTNGDNGFDVYANILENIMVELPGFIQEKQKREDP